MCLSNPTCLLVHASGPFLLFSKKMLSKVKQGQPCPKGNVLGRAAHVHQVRDTQHEVVLVWTSFQAVLSLLR